MLRQLLGIVTSESFGGVVECVGEFFDDSAFHATARLANYAEPVCDGRTAGVP
jgi:hypothetical protein